MPTRKSTALIYYGRAFGNMRRCLAEAKEVNHPSSAKTMQLKDPQDNLPCQVMHVLSAVEWCLLHHVPDWSQSTYKMTRLGYELIIKQLLQQQRIPADEANAALVKLSQHKGLKKNERTKKTSARRKKNLSPEQLADIQRYVLGKNNKWGKALLVWLKAGVATGLRPNEWQTAELSENEGRLLLTCENFKANETRSYAKERTIDLSGLPEEYITAVKEHLATVKYMQQNNLYDVYAKGCSDLLRLCNRKLWPKRKANVTLYTGRHQFSANAKASVDCDERERAAMMGHKTVITSRERYGKGRYGSKGITPNIADPSVLLKIQAPETSKPPFTPSPGVKKA